MPQKPSINKLWSRGRGEGDKLAVPFNLIIPAKDEQNLTSH